MELNNVKSSFNRLIDRLQGVETRLVAMSRKSDDPGIRKKLLNYARQHGKFKKSIYTCLDFISDVKGIRNTEIHQDNVSTTATNRGAKEIMKDITKNADDLIEDYRFLLREFTFPPRISALLHKQKNRIATARKRSFDVSL